jgi:hypothetical protein
MYGFCYFGLCNYFGYFFQILGDFFHNLLTQNKPHPTRVEQLILPIPGLGCEYWFNLKKDARDQLIGSFGLNQQ